MKFWEVVDDVLNGNTVCHKQWDDDSYIKFFAHRNKYTSFKYELGYDWDFWVVDESGEITPISLFQDSGCWNRIDGTTPEIDDVGLMMNELSEAVDKYITEATKATNLLATALNNLHNTLGKLDE